MPTKADIKKDLAELKEDHELLQDSHKELKEALDAEIERCKDLVEENAELHERLVELEQQSASADEIASAVEAERERWRSAVIAPGTGRWNAKVHGVADFICLVCRGEGSHTSNCSVKGLLRG